MKQTTKNDKHNDVGEENITNETKKNVERPEWIIIGGKKKWPRKCNHCGNIVFHASINRFYCSRKHNVKCIKCRQPNGEKNSFYGRKHSEKTLRLYSIKRKGKNNPMYGKVSAMKGKKHTEESIQKQILKKKEYWKSIGHECTDEFIKYRSEVTRLTNKQPIHLLENYDKRGKAGIDGAYHLDHIISVWNGFHNKLTPKQVSDISNLQFIPWLDNQRKWYK